MCLECKPRVGGCIIRVCSHGRPAYGQSDWKCVGIRVKIGHILSLNYVTPRKKNIHDVYTDRRIFYIN